VSISITIVLYGLPAMIRGWGLLVYAGKMGELVGNDGNKPENILKIMRT